MRRVMWTFACAILLCGPAAAVPGRPPDLSTTDAVMRWINGYRAKPNLAQVPSAVRTLSQLGALRDTETSAVYVGFVAGIMGSHPQKVDELVDLPGLVETAASAATVARTEGCRKGDCGRTVN